MQFNAEQQRVIEATGGHHLVLAPPGCGKTTLLRVIAKLEDFDSGEIYINKIPIKKVDFKTDISVLTNISETHIDFHDSYDRYKMMKKRK